MKQKYPKTLLRVGVGVIGLGAFLAAQAGTAFYDFNAQPPPDLNFVGNAEWRPSGGSGDTGYMSLFDSIDGLHASVLIPDFDNGLIVKAFTFECELRVGNPTGEGGRPADGFSISYARANDPVVADLSQEPPVDNQNNFALAGAPENGTRTGLAISFDTWSGNALPDGTDLEGIILRVDNVTLIVNGQRGIPMTTRNGACDDATSLQTGPYTGGLEGEGASDVSGLCWAPLKVELADTGELTVTWKGTVIANKIQTGFAPSPGRLVLAGRTGGANENTHVDNIRITTVAADKMIVGQPTGNAYGFQFTINDSGPSILDAATLVVKHDGTTVTPELYKPAGANMTTVSFTDLSTRIAAGTTHTVEVTAKDARGIEVTSNKSYTTPAYTLVPLAYKVSGTPTTPGMKSRTHKIDEASVTGFTARYPGNSNIIPNAEQQLAGGYLDPTTGLPYDNYADPVSSDIVLVNWDQSGGDIDANNPDNFNSVEPVGAEVPNDPIPGVDPLAANDNIVTEVTSYVLLKKGVIRMGVNSDDGFQVRVAPGQPSVTGVVLGQFNDGRGASDTIFDFVVEEEGYYPVRLTWWEGDGGANCEWFTVDVITGEKTLVNAAAATAVKTFRNGAGRAVVKSVLPANGYAGAIPTAKIVAQLIDGSTTVVDGSVQLIVDGADVTSSATIANGATTTVTYMPAGGFSFNSVHNWSLIWTESTTPATVWTNDFSFTVRRIEPDDLPATGAFWIEAEDWDYADGQTMADASVMPYVGGSYDGLAGTLNVDYFDDQNDGDGGINFTYRTDQRPNHANVTGNAGGRFGIDRPGTTDMSVNYRIGWVGNFWGNYTRTIPAGVYTAYAALSIDNSNVDAMTAPLDRVTDGVGTSTQTLERIGTFVGQGNGGWGNSELAALRGADGKQGYIKIGAGNTTLRVTANSGDFDWFVLIPATGVAPQLRSINPDGLRFALKRDDVISWTYEDFSTTVNPSTAQLTINGVAVPAAELSATKAGNLTTITYDAAGLFQIGKSYAYELTVKDSGGATLSQSGSFVADYMLDAPANMFVIEAEDFNTGGGQVIAAANTMPYQGAAYDGLSAVANIDYARSDNEGSGNIYRLDEVPNIPISAQNDENGTVRARDAAGQPSWSVTSNWRLGWAGDGRWQNYTRQIPAGDYQIWGSLSFGETPGAAVQVRGNLTKVTSDPTQANQTTENVGFFRGPATGGWGANRLFPLRTTTDTSGDAAVVTLGGATTLRFEYASGDFDYLMLVPVGGTPPPKFTKIQRSGGNLIIEWTGGGTLEVTDKVVGGTWSPTGLTSPATIPESQVQAIQFGRVRR